jgi:hypothetical protein
MIIFIYFFSIIIFLSMVNSQDIGQIPPDNGPVNMITLDKKLNEVRWEKFKSIYKKKYSSKQDEEYR